MTPGSGLIWSNRWLRAAAVAVAVALAGCVAKPVEPAAIAASVPVPLMLPGTIEPSEAPLSGSTLEEVTRRLAVRPPEIAPDAPLQAADVGESPDALKRYLSGRTAAIEGDLSAAVVEFERAHRLDPRSVAILRELARVHSRLGNAARAAEGHERLLALEPRDPEALFSAGIAAASRGDLPRAVDRLATLHRLGAPERDSGLAIFRSEAKVIADLALARALSSLRADRAAAEVLGRARSGAPSDLPPAVRAELDLTLGDALARCGDLAGAAAAWDRAAAVDRQPERNLPRRMWASLRLGRVSEAAVTLRSHVESSGADDLAVGLARWFARARPREAADLAEAFTDARLVAALVGPARGASRLARAIESDPAGASAELLRDRFAAISPDAAIAEAMRIADRHPERAEACAAALVRSGATAGMLLAALDRAGTRPERMHLEIALAAALGDGSRLDRCVRDLAAERDPDLLAAAAAAMARTGDRRRARELAEAALAASPNAAARAVLAQGRLEEALSAAPDDRGRLLDEANSLLDAALGDGRAPESAWRTRLAVADAIADPELRAAARDAVRRALPGSPLVRQLDREALLAEGRVAEALDRAAIEAAATPTDLEAFRFTVAGVPRTGRGEWLRPWLLDRQLAMPAEPESLEAYVAWLLAAGEDPRAFDLLRRRAEGTPADPFAETLLERALVDRGRVREAFEAAVARRATRVGPAGIREELRFVALALEADEPLAAIEAVEGSPGWSLDAAGLFFARAQRLADGGRRADAAGLLTTAFERSGSLPVPIAVRFATAACALDAAVGGRWERSLERLRRVRSRGGQPFSREGDPAESEAEAIHRLSGLHSFLGDRDGADRILGKALEIDPDHVLSLNNLAYSAIDRGEIDAETVRRIERAHQLRPDDASILDTLGWLRYKQGRFRDDASGPGAITLISRSIRVRPDDPGLEPLDHLGDALWRSGDRSAAIRAWRAAEELLPVRHPLETIVRGLPEYERDEHGIRLLDPEEFWRRSYADVAGRAARKAATALAGGEPDVAPLARPAPGT